jgi:hypothetical protein
MEITLHLDDEQARKLAYIQQHTNQDIAVVIERAIDQCYEQLQQSDEPQQLPDPDPLAKLRNSAFIGCFKGASDLATRSEEIFREIMDEKYDCC